MKIVICGSINFVQEIKKISDELVKIGYEVEMPLTAQKILNGELSMEDYNKEKFDNDAHLRKIQDDVIRRYFNVIKECDGILVVNYDKNGISNYIGGNTFLEIGFAHILNKNFFY
ncbi:MAG: hypothetical protein PHT51_02000 [Patescibacteria group bacterium]|nr:hypothetical protein [Patescibacteria group bacterium]MDD4611000.1 hypothetical protein [Patescibacteria group bacterium]